MEWNNINSFNDSVFEKASTIACASLPLISTTAFLVVLLVGLCSAQLEQRALEVVENNEATMAGHMSQELNVGDDGIQTLVSL